MSQRTVSLGIWSHTVVKGYIKSSYGLFQAIVLSFVNFIKIVIKFILSISLIILFLRCTIINIHRIEYDIQIRGCKYPNRKKDKSYQSKKHRDGYECHKE